MIVQNALNTIIIFHPFSKVYKIQKTMSSAQKLIPEFCRCSLVQSRWLPQRKELPWEEFEGTGGIKRSDKTLSSIKVATSAESCGDKE